MPKSWIPSFWIKNSLSHCFTHLQVRERLRAALERVATLEEQLVDAHRQVRGTWAPAGLGMLPITLGSSCGICIWSGSL